MKCRWPRGVQVRAPGEARVRVGRARPRAGWRRGTEAERQSGRLLLRITGP